MGIEVIDENNMALCAIVIAGIQLLGFIVAALFKLNNLVHCSSGLGLTVVALLTFFLSQTYAPRQIVITVFVAVWGARQIVVTLMTMIPKTNENECCERNSRYLLLLFWSWFSQIGYVFALSLVVIFTNSVKYSSDEFGAWEIVGTVIACLGLLIEILADAQVFFFKKNPENKEKFCDAGVWKWSRHPTLFGDIVLFWGIFVMNCGVLSGGDWTAVFSPAAITMSIIFGWVTGYEQCHDRLYGELESYRAYKYQTSPLIPFPPFLYKILPTFAKFLFFCEFPCYNKLDSSGQTKTDVPTEKSEIV
ncbi:hypothetical protein HOLleu_12561 [Holothuria leucospilota]|uniref:Steroid 5-alpha reductase C-terminal domain-containing protein n=1 Tax=Holothuria leucospilota TaxID=206669 RepID=A0A9Q1C9F2_HOLLE|nr:hypothetical protein HOLleu_12561 [Holothuria leucospilota]